MTQRAFYLRKRNSTNHRVRRRVLPAKVDGEEVRIMDAEKTGSFIARIRKEQGLTQKQLAEKLFVSDKAVSRWEAAHGMPGLDNLEALSAALGVSVAELLRGERIVEPVVPQEADALAAESIGLANQRVRSRRLQNLAMGFLAGVCLIILAVVHLTAPIAIPYRDGLVRADELSDGTLVVISDAGSAGIDVSMVGDETHVSVYDTRWNQMMRENRELVALAGRLGETEAVLYYPGAPDDVLVYGQLNDAAGVATLPRLIYNMWLAIGLVASAIGLGAWALLRKRWYGKRVLYVTLIPACFTVALVAVLWGHFGEVYNAAFYLSGILLVAAALYGLALLAITRKNLH